MAWRLIIIHSFLVPMRRISGSHAPHGNQFYLAPTLLRGSVYLSQCLRRFVKDKRKLHATDYPDASDNLQRVFDALNWMFDEASKVEIK